MEYKLKAVELQLVLQVVVEEVQVVEQLEALNLRDVQNHVYFLVAELNFVVKMKLQVMHLWENNYCHFLKFVYL